MREQQGAEDKDTHKRSIVLSDYNLVFQEVVPLNVSLHPPVTKKKKQKRLRKIPLRFQEVLEVSTERSPVHFVDLSQHHAVTNVHKDPEPQEVRETFLDADGSDDGVLRDGVPGLLRNKRI